MFSANRLNFSRLGLVAALASFLAVGCGDAGANKALNQAMTDAGKSIEAVYPFAGKVTIDRDPPKLEPGYRLVIVLFDQSQPDLPAIRRPHVEVNNEGQFAFSTYNRGDGLKPGKYVVTFGVFKHQRVPGLVPPDQLGNRYNDPDANAQIPEFVIDHKAPGKKDYEFNLDVKGKEAVTDPGSRALMGVMDENDPGARRALRRGRGK